MAEEDGDKSAGIIGMVSFIGENVAEKVGSIPLRKMDRRTTAVYVGLLLLTILVIIIGVIDNRVEEMIIAVPIAALIGITLVMDREFIHVPPALILMIVVIMLIMQATKYFRDESPVLNVIASMLTGMVLCLVGLMIAYMALGKVPGFANERPGLIALESFAIGLALFNIWMMIIYFIPMSGNSGPDGTGRYRDMGFLMNMDVSVMVGCMLTAFVYYEGNHNDVIRRFITNFMVRSNLIKEEPSPLTPEEELINLIKAGESDTLEFKSTLHTNLATGQSDKRMEKAVLKTLVAFLNTSGGTLLVGVEDNGNIMGAEVEDYENIDKMFLNIKSLISSQIGDEFLPFVGYRGIYMGKKTDKDGNPTDIDRVVIKFVCEPTLSPVFHKDGKTQTFYVRSGPSSIELTGLELINYVNNRKKKHERKRSAPRLAETKDDPEQNAEGQERPER